MSNPPKPLAARLDDIEAKMNELLDAQSSEGFIPINNLMKSVNTKMEEIIKTNEMMITSNLQAGIKFDNIDMKMIKSEINEEMILAINKIKLVPFEWIELFMYCNKNDLSPEMMMELAKIMNKDYS